MSTRKRVRIAVCVIVFGFPFAMIKSNPFDYCGYCQHQKTEKWIPRNAYPCSFWRYIFTANSSDFTLYLNTPGG
jgi:hypothetical protein